MNIREKEIIRNLRSKDAEVKNRQVAELFYGKGKDTEQLRNQVNKVVLYCYSGLKYKDMRREIYDTLVSLICEDIWNAPDEVLDNIDNLSWYFFRLSRNCANRMRNYIHVCIGVKTDVAIGPSNDKESEDDSTEDAISIFLDENRADDEQSRDDVALDIINRYISKIPRKEYRDIIVAIDINDWSHEKIAKEFGICDKDINRFHRRAKVALTQVALPDIKNHCADFFYKNRDLLSEKDGSMLQLFFDGTDKLKTSEIAKIYIKLIKVVKKNRAEKAKSWKRSVRDYKAQIKEFENTEIR